MVRLEIDIKEVDKKEIELSKGKVYDFTFTFVVGDDVTKGEKVIAQEIKEIVCECLYSYITTDTDEDNEDEEEGREIVWN